MKDDSDKIDEWPSTYAQLIALELAALERKETEQVKIRQNELNVRIGERIAAESVDIGKYRNMKLSDYQDIYFHYDDEQLRKFYLWAASDKQIKKVTLSKQFAYMTGFSTTTDDIVVYNEFAKYSPDIAPLHSFYVYATNLVANTVIGDTNGPLIRIVNVPSRPSVDAVEVEEIIYSPENFHQVLPKQLSEIRIEILSDSGRAIEFNSGNCILTLHFKKALF